MPVTVLLFVVVTVVLFMIFGRVYAFILLPLALTMWTIYGRTIHRRKLRRALDRVPQWKITPE